MDNDEDASGSGLLAEALGGWRARLAARPELDGDQQDLLLHMDHLILCSREGAAPRDPGMPGVPSNAWVMARAFSMLANEIETGDPMTNARCARIAGREREVRDLSPREQSVVARLRALVEAPPRLGPPASDQAFDQKRRGGPAA